MNGQCIRFGNSSKPRPDEHVVTLDQLELAEAILADFGLDRRTLPAPFEDEFETDRRADAQDVADAGAQRGVAAGNALDLDVMRTHVGYRFADASSTPNVNFLNTSFSPGISLQAPFRTRTAGGKSVLSRPVDRCRLCHP
jgi:hypothetical protein